MVKTKTYSHIKKKRTQCLIVHLVYELAVLKKYAKPLLDEIDRSVPEYSEAKRLSTLLEYFDDMDETAIPNNSILREFIGGSIFEY